MQIRTSDVQAYQQHATDNLMSLSSFIAQSTDE